MTSDEIRKAEVERMAPGNFHYWTRDRLVEIAESVERLTSRFDRIQRLLEDVECRCTALAETVGPLSEPSQSDVSLAESVLTGSGTIGTSQPSTVASPTPPRPTGP